MNPQTFNEENFHKICDHLARRDAQLKMILCHFGYPPYWTRPNSFETLVLTILEQQVSLASAYAAYQKLKNRLPELTPQALLQLSDDELRQCSLTRQKISYTKGLASAINKGDINLADLGGKEDDVVRKTLKVLKGIGDWTVDVYLLHSLQRADIFPLGDLALINAIRMVYADSTMTKEHIAQLSIKWIPYRSIATMMFWHYYIKKKNIKILY